MKVAILGESAADEAAVRIPLEGLLQAPTEPAGAFPLRHRAVEAALKALRPVLLHLYYRTDAEGLVVVLDSDRTPVHPAGYRGPAACEPDCRLCRMRDIMSSTKATFRPVPGRPPLHTALGLAVP